MIDPELWARIDRVLHECDARHLPSLAPFIAATDEDLDKLDGATAFVVDTGKYAEHRRGQWVTGLDPEQLTRSVIPIVDAARQLGYEPAELGLAEPTPAPGRIRRWLARMSRPTP